VLNLCYKLASQLIVQWHAIAVLLISLECIYNWTLGKVWLLYSVASKVILANSHSHAQPSLCQFWLSSGKVFWKSAKYRRSCTPKFVVWHLHQWAERSVYTVFRANAWYLDNVLICMYFNVYWIKLHEISRKCNIGINGNIACLRKALSKPAFRLHVLICAMMTNQ